MNKIFEMLKLQQQLNDNTNGKDWEEGFTKNNKFIDWRRCIYLECAELIESYPWKHWKNIDTPPDYDNIKIEVVDIWHFIMSQALKEYKEKSLGSIKDLSKKIKSLPNFDKLKSNKDYEEEDTYTQITIIEKLIKLLFDEAPIEEVMEVFIDIATQSELDLDTLYELYIGKNILNQFRQNNGYKEGTYIKVWDGEEDNVVMQSFLQFDKNISPDGLYQMLETVYPRK